MMKLLFFFLVFVSVAFSSPETELVVLIRAEIKKWGKGLGCLYVCNNIAGHYLTLCPAVCKIIDGTK